MQPPLTPSDETARLYALRALGLLDTQPEERFDAITRTAARLFQVPIALVSLVDLDRQWFKSRHGLGATETPRDISFCGHAILHDEILVVEHAQKDPRFFDNPLVTGPPYIQFYAGLPLRSPSGHRVGTLCLIDQQPRPFTFEDRAALTDLGRWAAQTLASEGQVAQDAERRYEAVVSSLAEGIVLQNAEGAILASNESARTILGLTEDQMHGRTSLDPRWASIRPDGSPFPGEEHPAMVCLRDGQPLDAVEMGVQLPSGEVRWISINARALLDSDLPRPFAVVTSFLDITERKRMETRLEQTYAFQRALLDGAGSLILATDHEGLILSANPALTPMLGWRPEDLVGQAKLESLFAPARLADRAERLTSELGRPVASGFEALALPAQQAGKDIRDWELRRKDGKALTCTLTLSLLPLPGQAQPGYMGIFTDVTRLREAEKQVELLAEVARRTDNGVLLSDPEGRATWVNEGFTRLTGFTLLELIGRKPSELLQKEDVDQEVVDRMHAARLAGEAFSEEVLNHAKDGRAYWVALEVQPLRDPEGRLTGFMGLQRDITQRKWAEQMKDDFIATVSHELRTPLTSVRGALGLLTSGSLAPLAETQQEMATIALKNAERLGRLVDDILDLQKSEAGRMTFAPHTWEARGLLEEAAEAMGPYAQARQVTLRVLGDAEGLQLHVDAERLHQVLLNLISNAIKFSPEGGQVALAAQLSADRVLLSVQDQGAGIPVGFRARVFEKFAQAHTGSTRFQGGTGLGLSIVKSLTERMGGAVTFETGSKGTRFIVAFPRSSLESA